MTVIDVCLFAGEGQMLALRMLTLAESVDEFVALACNTTHQGVPLTESERAQISAEFMTAVLTAKCPKPARLEWVSPQRTLTAGRDVFERAPDERGPAGSRWFQHIERQHRDGMADAVKKTCTDPMTVVLMSDVDEIPTPAAVNFASRVVGERMVCAQRFHSTALEVLHPQQPWWGTCISLLRDCEPQNHRDARAAIGTPDQGVMVIDHAGWHFSWFGTDAERQRKLETFSHAELVGVYDPALGRETLRHANGEELRRLTLEETYRLDWPLPILDGSFPIPDQWLLADADRS